MSKVRGSDFKADCSCKSDQWQIVADPDSLAAKLVLQDMFINSNQSWAALQSCTVQLRKYASLAKFAK